MKNIIIDSQNNNNTSKINICETIFNCSPSSNEIKNININENNGKNNIKKTNKKINMEDNNKIKLLNKISLNNKFLINSILFKDDYCFNWPKGLNDLMSSTADLSFKEENNNIENNSNIFENQNLDNIIGKELNFNVYSNNIGQQNKDLDNNEDFCSKMTNLYAQGFQDEKMIDYLLE